MEGQGKLDSPIQSEENGRLGSRRRFLTDHELALIDEMLLAVAPQDDVELRVRKSSWRFVASVWCHGADPQDQRQIGLVDYEQSPDGDRRPTKDPSSKSRASSEESQPGAE